MILLKFVCFENYIEFEEGYINIIEISDKKLFKKATYLINKYSKNIEDGNDIVFTDNNTKLDIYKNIMVINDFFNIDINTNKIIKSLYQAIEKQYNYEYGDENLLLNLKGVFSNIQEVLSSYDFELDYKREIRLPELLKCIGVKFNEYYYDNPFDNVICWFDIISSFNLYKVVVFINFKSFFTEEEIIEIYKAALYRQIKLVLIEYSLESELIGYESKLYIDENFDEFLLKK